MTARDRRSFLRDAGLAAAATGAPLSTAFATASDSPAPGAAFCPHPNPVVHENRCTDPATFSTSFQVKTSWSMVTGYARRPSVNVGEALELVVSGPNLWLSEAGEPPAEAVEVDVYRLGYYDGRGGRKVWSTPAPVSTFQKVDGEGRPSNAGARRPPRPVDAATGLSGRADDRTVLTIPGTALQTSGVYLAKLRGRWLEFPPGTSAVQRSGEAHVVFIVRDDDRPRDLLVLLPTNTWQAYNYEASRSLYTVYSRFGHAGELVPATGTERAAKVSLDRPHNNWAGETNWVLRTEFPAIWWLERHGYDVTYTDDTALHFAPEQALPARSRGLVILGHGEYWTKQMRDGVEAARDAGTNVYNLGANTGYWRVRYETTAGKPATSLADARVLVCFKTVEGGGTDQPQVSGQSDPVEPTTTWRDPGKGPGVDPPGTTAATPTSYQGNDRPERTLFGVQYIGDDDMTSRGLSVPPANDRGEFAAHRAWRHTTLPGATGATIGTDLVGWEWDGVPLEGQPFSGPPPTTKPGTGGVQRLSATDPRAAAPPGAVVEYLLDAGRRYSVRARTGAEPPAGWTAVANAVTYTAPSGALVFSAGTIHWSWGLGPHFLDRNGEQTYVDPPVDTSQPAIGQATANLLADGAIYPLTPEGLVFDPHGPDPTTPTSPTTPTTPTTPPDTTPTTPEPTTPPDTTPTTPTTPEPTTPTTPEPTTPEPTTPTTPEPTTPTTPATPDPGSPATDPPPNTDPEPGGESGQAPEPERPGDVPLQQQEPAPPRVDVQVTPHTGVPVPPTQQPQGPPARVTAPPLELVLVGRSISRTGVVSARLRTERAGTAALRGTVELTVDRRRIARASFAIEPGSRSTRLKLRISRSGRKQLTKHGKLKPLVRIRLVRPTGQANQLARVTIQARD